MSESDFFFGDWAGESLRLSIFCPESAQVPNQSSGLWEQVVGAEPTSIDVRPSERVVREIGEVGGNDFVLVTQNGRLDWILQPRATPSSNVMLTLTDMPQAHGLFRSAFHRSLEQKKIALRVAFAPVLIAEATDVRQGYYALSSFLPKLELETLDTTDFIYRVNRRRRSEVFPAALLNRLAQWSLEQALLVSVSMASTGQPRVLSPRTIVRKLTLDINTLQGAPAMSADNIAGLLDEMITASKELAVQGDVS